MSRTQCVLTLLTLFVGLAQSWDIALSKGDVLEFYSNATKTDAVRFENQNLAALAYDEVHNMMLYVDKQSHGDAVCGYNMSSSQYKCFTERNGRNIQGLAFDPATELCFFSDTNERSINWFSLKPGSDYNVYGNIKLNKSTPADIAVDSCRGYIYWINTKKRFFSPSIERVRFDGSESKVLTYCRTYTPYSNKTHKMEPHSLVIDQQAQKMYWFQPRRLGKYDLYSADLDGKNRRDKIWYTIGFRKTNHYFNVQNAMTVSNKSLYTVEWCEDCFAWEFRKTEIEGKHRAFKPLFALNNEVPVGIAANYKISEQIQGIQECNNLKALIRNDSNDSLKVATEYVGPFCVHGVRVNGQSICKCTPGYTGERCDVSVCEKHCIQGNCSLNDKGLPECRCNAGYSGERCEVYACHDYCLNNGNCSLNEKSEPVCQCQGDYGGDRCDASDCRNYCIQGNCTLNDEAHPECRCNAGYSGERCEVYACRGYCLNNGVCSLNEKEEPVCQCDGNYGGSRCEAVKKQIQGIQQCIKLTGLVRNLRLRCFSDNIQGKCSLNDEGLPECRCNAGYSGKRCEAYACRGYWLNNGVCSLNKEDEPGCQCDGNHEGSRCEALANKWR